MGVDAGGVRDAWPHALAAVARWCGDVSSAEDAVQEAVTRLLASGSDPDSVEAWLITTAKRVVIDESRRGRTEVDRRPEVASHRAAVVPAVDDDSRGPDRLELALGDDRLAMLYTACDPALDQEDRLALTLRFVLGAPTADIADVLLVRHTAMSARLTRAKKRLAHDGFGRLGTLRGRLPDMLAALHALFTLGHASPRGTTLSDPSAQATAIDLTRRLHTIVPEDPETSGLLALMMFVGARAATRDEPLEAADRRRWDRAGIDEGMVLTTSALPHGGRFALEAGIAGLHSTARTWGTTDWRAIVALYDRLIEVWPSPPAELGRAVALSQVDGQLVRALADIDAVSGASERHVAAARADVLARLGRSEEADDEYARAILLEGNAAAREWLRRRRATHPTPWAPAK